MTYLNSCFFKERKRETKQKEKREREIENQSERKRESKKENKSETERYGRISDSEKERKIKHELKKIMPEPIDLVYPGKRKRKRGRKRI